MNFSIGNFINECENNNLENIKLIYENIRYIPLKYKNLSLKIACENKNQDIFIYLLNQYGENYDIDILINETYIYENIKILKLILDHPTFNLNFKKTDRIIVRTVLFSNEDIFKFIIEKFKNYKPNDNYLYNMLLYSCINKKYNIIKLLLENYNYNFNNIRNFSCIFYLDNIEFFYWLINNNFISLEDIKNYKYNIYEKLILYSSQQNKKSTNLK